MIVATYVYTDENGNPLYRKLRDEKKRFTWERHDGGRWVSGRGGGDCPLYNLPAVIKAVESGMVIVITEGEKDADRLIKAGFVATTSPDGASTPWRGSYTRTLSGAAHVKIYADYDDKGHAHAQDVYKELYGSVGELEIFEADLDFKGADVSDHLDAGKTLKQMRRVEPDIPPSLGPRPEYPVDKLCGPLRDFAKWAERNGLHPEAAGHFALGALAAVCGDARITEPERVSPSLWLTIIGAQGTGKSPAMRQAFELIEAEDERNNELHDVACMEAEMKREQGGFAGNPRPPISLMVSNATPEALIRDMRDGNGAAAIIVDELDAFLSSMGAYNTSKRGGQAEFARYREMWSGRPISNPRVGSGGASNAIRLYIRNPVLTICGGMQPSIVYKLGGVTNGDWARWLPASVPPGTPEMPEESEPKPQSWTQAMTKLIRHRGIRREWKLKGESFRLLDEARKRWKQQKYDVPEHVAQGLIKASDQACRIALVIAESMDPARGGEIPPGAMQSAIAIMDYCVQVWESIPGERSVLATSADDRAGLDAAQRLLEWIQRREPDENGVRKVTKRDIMRAKVAGCKTAEAASRMIREYVDLYPGTREQVNRAGGTTVYIREPVSSG